MAESSASKDNFLAEHTDFCLREQMRYPNGGISRFYDNGMDMVIIDEGICAHNPEKPVFHICLSQTSKITICINLKEFLDFWGIPKRKLKNIF